MAITSTGLNAATNAEYAETTTVEDKSILGKDDFMMLLLTELQHQDPTEPMDSDKILTQTSQLASLESAENTNTALENLTAALASTQDFSTVNAIGKRADLGSDAISLDEGSSATFEMYFPEDIASGTIEITDSEGSIVATMDITNQTDSDGNILEVQDSGVYQFTWDGNTASGSSADSGIYHINADYKSADGTSNTTRIGAYPIESVRFEDGEAYVKLGSTYVPMANVVEIY